MILMVILCEIDTLITISNYNQFKNIVKFIIFIALLFLKKKKKNPQNKEVIIALFHFKYSKL